VMHDRQGPTRAIVFGRDSQNRRFIANTANDATLLAELTQNDFLGANGVVQTTGEGVNIIKFD